MKLQKLLMIGVLLILISGCSKSLIYNSAKTKSECCEKNGYWYNGKCWKNFEDEGISISKIDSVVLAEMEIIEKSKIEMDGKMYPLISFLPIEEDGGYMLIAVYGTKENYKTLILPTKKKNITNGVFETACLLFNGDAIAGTLGENPIATGTATVNVVNIDHFDIEICGMVSDNEKGNVQEFSFIPNESISGAGNSFLEIKGNEAYLSGDLGTITYQQIKNLIKNNPEVRTIVMTNISGSVNDAVNMHTGRLLRENEFTTKVLSTSDIASGGVDLFCAGKKRIVEKGAKIGVHSWCCVNDLTAIDIPKDHPAHQYQLEYFAMALGIDIGPSFYFYTLSAAPFNGIHYMTEEEIKKWNIATDFIEKE